MNPNAIIICLIGLPASGKSLLALNIAQNLKIRKKFEPIIIIDIDRIRRELFGDNFYPEREEIVIAEKKNQIETILQNINKKKSQTKDKNNSSNLKLPLIILDDMHYLNSMRRDMLHLAKKMNAYYFSIFLDTSLETCLKWNDNREFQVPHDVIQRIANQFDKPGKKYAWDHPKMVFSPKNEKLSIFLDRLNQEFQNIFYSNSSFHQSNQQNMAITKKKSFKSNVPLNNNKNNHDSLSNNSIKHQLDLQTRELWNQIIHGYIEPEIFQKLIDLLLKLQNNNKIKSKMLHVKQESKQNPNILENNNFESIITLRNLKNVSPSFLDFFISLRKNFLIWLFQHSINTVSTEILFTFLLNSMIFKDKGSIKRKPIF
ncbi:MAG: AAA family ATPase [Candidatus Lokiarchaeota archaeon]|nr:AAA family ATPase [Candidatus Harpocratesius repetitus]